MQNLPLVNSWTEFETLEAVIVGAVHDDDCHPEPEPNARLKFVKNPEMNKIMSFPVGPRAKPRVKRAQE